MEKEGGCQSSGSRSAWNPSPVNPAENAHLKDSVPAQNAAIYAALFNVLLSSGNNLLDQSYLVLLAFTVLSADKLSVVLA